MLKDKKFMVPAIIVLVASIFLAGSTVKHAFAETGTVAQTNQISFTVTPLIIINYSAVPGEKFAVDINTTVLGAAAFHGFTMRLSYDPSLINCTDVTNGNLFQASSTTDFNFSLQGNVYASANFTSPDATTVENGTLVTLTFQVKATGETSLHIYDAFIYNSTGTYLPTVYDGYFNNKFNFDLTMPLTLLTVTFASLFLNLKTEKKLKDILESTELRVRDSVLIVGLMVVMITLIVVVRQLSVILMVLFLFSYSLLLYTFGYLISNKRWYVGIIPPAAFILLYVFLRDSFIWTYYLSNVYGLVFAIMITLYLAGLFNWKTTAVFGVLLTAMDIVMVLVTKTMVQAANAAVSLSLPVLVSLPLVPFIKTGTGLLILSLGLGDFFFAGLLAIQTFKKYGKRLAIASVLGMTVSFSIFEAFILTFGIGAFPGTLMIICGWAPFVIAKTLMDWNKTKGASLEKVVSS